MSNDYDQINDEFLSLAPSIIAWHQITSLSIAQPYNSTHLFRLFSHTTNLRTLDLHYRSKYDYRRGLDEDALIDLLDDTSLCNMLMSNGLRQLNIFTTPDRSNLLDIAYLIVERLPYLQVIEATTTDDEIVKISHILISGLKKLNFLIIRGCIQYGKINEKRLRDLQNPNTRSFRTEIPKTMDEDTVCIWL
jgi:hypothetical protein